MAILNPRVLPLLETLVEADADWLAFEIVEALQVGRAAEESDAHLRKTQDAVRHSERQAQVNDQVAESAAPLPIPMEEQVRWAAEYITRRLTDAIALFRPTFTELEKIVSAQSEPGSDPEARKEHEPITLVLRTGVGDLVVRPSDAAVAEEALAGLQNAIEDWLASTEGGERG